MEAHPHGGRGRRSRCGARMRERVHGLRGRDALHDAAFASCTGTPTCCCPSTGDSAHQRPSPARRAGSAFTPRVPSRTGPSPTCRVHGWRSFPGARLQARRGLRARLRDAGARLPGAGRGGGERGPCAGSSISRAPSRARWSWSPCVSRAAQRDGVWAVLVRTRPGGTETELMAAAERTFVGCGTGRLTMDMVLAGPGGRTRARNALPRIQRPIERERDAALRPRDRGAGGIGSSSRGRYAMES